MEVKKAKVDGKLYDVVSIEEYPPNKDMFGDIAVECDGIVYPERGLSDTTRPGVYNYGCYSYFVKPQEHEINEYSSNNIIDFKSKDIKELIQKSDKLKDMEREILTNPDNIYHPPLLDNDEPEVRGLKEAIIAKNIDITKYQHRWGKNFQNDRRGLSEPRMSIDKYKIALDKLDIKATLVLEDKNENVPNPMGRKIIVDLV